MTTKSYNFYAASFASIFLKTDFLPTRAHVIYDMPLPSRDVDDVLASPHCINHGYLHNLQQKL